MKSPFHSAQGVYRPRVHHILSHTAQPDHLPKLAHEHDDLHEISLIVSGDALYATDHQRYAVAAGDMIYCAPNIHHTLLPHDNLRYYSILFDFMPAHQPAVDILPHGVYRCGDALPDLELMFALLCARTRHEQPAVLSHLLSAMLLVCADSAPVAPTLTIDKTLPAFTMSLFIDQHYPQDICLADIAEAAGITSSHAIHVFKPVFGLSPVQHLNRRRIGQAQAALLTTRQSASQIASEIGIGNINYFYTVFKKLVGLSPTSYRTHFSEKIMHCTASSS